MVLSIGRGSKKGDIVFFITQARYYQKELKPYHFTGVLVCSYYVDRESLPEADHISKDYIRRYELSYVDHIRDDIRNNKERTKQIRGKKIIIGKPHPNISRWFGDTTIEVSYLLRKFGMHRQAKNLRLRNTSIPELNHEQAVTLYKYLMSRTKGSIGMGAFPPSSNGKSCKSCHR